MDEQIEATRKFNKCPRSPTRDLAQLEWCPALSDSKVCMSLPPEALSFLSKEALMKSECLWISWKPITPASPSGPPWTIEVSSTPTFCCDRKGWSHCQDCNASGLLGWRQTPREECPLVWLSAEGGRGRPGAGLPGGSCGTLSLSAAQPRGEEHPAREKPRAQVRGLLVQDPGVGLCQRPLHGPLAQTPGEQPSGSRAGTPGSPATPAVLPCLRTI